MQEICGEQYAPRYDNSEQSLQAIFRYAFIAAFDQYVKVEALPSGKGIADVIFIPAPLSMLPALVAELRWDMPAGGAIAQIMKNKYPETLRSFERNILLVGISYDSGTGRHTCRIDKA